MLRAHLELSLKSFVPGPLVPNCREGAKVLGSGCLLSFPSLPSLGARDSPGLWEPGQHGVLTGIGFPICEMGAAVGRRVAPKIYTT